jgi:hypothetical protein
MDMEIYLPCLLFRYHDNPACATPRASNIVYGLQRSKARSNKNVKYKNENKAARNN